jgi:hypothetical protein
MMQQNQKPKKRILLDLCVSSLRRGHANLLCIVPSLFRATVLLPGLIVYPLVDIIIMCIELEQVNNK